MDSRQRRCDFVVFVLSIVVCDCTLEVDSLHGRQPGFSLEQILIDLLHGNSISINTLLPFMACHPQEYRTNSDILLHS